MQRVRDLGIFSPKQIPPSNPSPQGLGELWEWRQKQVGARRDRGGQENKALQISMIKAHISSGRLRQPAQHMNGSTPGTLNIYYGFKLRDFMLFLSTSRFLFLVPSAGFFSSCLFVQFGQIRFCFILQYYILFYFYPLRAYLLGNERKKWSESECEGHGEEVEGGETYIYNILHTYLHATYLHTNM